MIYSVKGEVVHTEPNLAVIECGGVGYACRTTFTTLSKLKGIGSQAKLYTYLNVTQDGIDLFGFYEQQELRCFQMLLSVSGVGPKAALSILSDISPEKFALTVATGDYKTITKSKGIGTKTAQRIVLELKDKIAKEQLSTPSSVDFSAVTEAVANTNTGEAIAALVVLGYTQAEAATVVSGLDASLSTEELIKQSLKKIGMRL
ncbi:MAG: Holliday junction branch migration protein RuvA [Ruminococcus sp.]|nr:Holliday junction branch migration protein RuvA [Ruminococcus sp.]